MRSSLTGRAWGDGHTTRPRHIVHDIQFGERSSALRCADGTVLQATTPAGLEALWQEHGGAIVEPRAEDRRPPDEGEVERWRLTALAAIRFMGRTCTCTVDSDIKDCANYIADDDEELPEEDE